MTEPKYLCEQKTKCLLLLDQSCLRISLCIGNQVEKMLTSWDSGISQMCVDKNDNRLILVVTGLKLLKSTLMIPDSYDAKTTENQTPLSHFA